MKTVKLIVYILLAMFLWYAVAYGDPLVVPPILPNEVMTPGVVDQNATKEKVCTPGYSSSVRNVPQHVKIESYQEYGIFSHQEGEYEIDHLISLELGGSNDIKNLWPQSFKTVPWNAHLKDKLENKLHQMVCDDLITLEDAQKRISGDWIKSYCEIFNNENCQNNKEEK